MLICSIKSCLNKPNFQCFCEKSSNLFCNAHLSEHFSIYHEIDHKIQLFENKLNSETKQELIKYFHNKIEKLAKEKKAHLFHYFEKIKRLELIFEAKIESLRESIDENSKILKEIIETEEIPAIETIKLQEALVLPEKENKELIENMSNTQTNEIIIESDKNEIESLPLYMFQPPPLDKLLEPIFTCDICIVTKQASKFITLNCEHRYCEKCLKLYYTDLISQGKIAREFFVCPRCSIEIDVNIITSSLSPEEKEKLETYFFQNWKPNNEEEKDSVYFKCPTQSCSFHCIVPCNFDEVKCWECAKKWYPRCQNPPHPQSTCEDNREIIALLEKGDIVECPWCKYFVEKCKGDKYMICKSPECLGMRYFCYECKKKLLEHHQIHKCIGYDFDTKNRCSVF